MTQINEVKKAYYLASGIPLNDVMDMEYAWLVTQVGSFRGSLQDMWNEYFRLNGYLNVNNVDDFNSLLMDAGINQVSFIDDYVNSGGGKVSVYIIGADGARLLGADGALLKYQ